MNLVAETVCKTVPATNKKLIFQCQNMKNIKQKLFSLLKLKTILVVALIVITGTILGLTGLVLSNFKNFKSKEVNHGKFSCMSLYKKGSHEEFFCYARYKATFDLAEDWVSDSSCKSIPWGGYVIENISYNKKYIQDEKKMEGSGCSVKRIHRFKSIKRGCTKITIDDTIHHNGIKYRILIF